MTPEETQDMTDFVLEFEKQFGRLPNIGDFMMRAEIMASIAIDGGEVRTVRLEE